MTTRLGKNIRRFLLGAAVLLILWIFMAQFVLFKNRMTDSTIERLFESKDVAISIHDTLVRMRNLHYAVTGSDTLPTLVFIHGSPGSWSNYRKFMWDDTLLARFRMV